MTRRFRDKQRVLLSANLGKGTIKGGKGCVSLYVARLIAFHKPERDGMSSVGFIFNLNEGGQRYELRDGIRDIRCILRTDRSAASQLRDLGFTAKVTLAPAGI